MSIVRVITRFDKEKEVFRPKFAIVNERKHRVENLNNLYKTRTTYKKQKEERSLKNQRTNLKTNLKLEFTKIKTYSINIILLDFLTY